MASDLTAILLHDKPAEDEIRRRVIERGYGDVLLRVTPLDKVNLTQVEVLEAGQGLPCADPQLLIDLTTSGGRGVFLHVNHEAEQAVIHSFEGGQEKEGFAGKPGEEFDAKVRTHTGVSIDAIVGADDGSRVGFGVAATRTEALVRGKRIVLPPGTPTGLHSFVFHDRGAGLGEKGDGGDEGAGERLAWFAFDPQDIELAFSKTPANELAARIKTAPQGSLGPLDGAREQVVGALGALGTKTLSDSDPNTPNLTALYEAVALESGVVFAGGDAMRYWDERVLPMFSLSDGEPVIDASDVAELDARASVLDAMVEVLPAAAPPGGEGSLVHSIGDEEIGPLAPLISDSGEYAGSVFIVNAARLLERMREFGGDKLPRLATQFLRAWYRAAKSDLPEGDAFMKWQQSKEEAGQEDLDRFVEDWASLRALCEIALANKLQIAMVLYGAE